MRKILLPAVLALTALPLIAQAEIYTWKDSQGRVQYSDSPPPKGVKARTVVAPPPPPPAAEPEAAPSGGTKAPAPGNAPAPEPAPAEGPAT